MLVCKMLNKDFVFLKTHSIVFDDIISFMGQNGRPLEVKNKNSLTLLSNK